MDPYSLDHIFLLPHARHARIRHSIRRSDKMLCLYVTPICALGAHIPFTWCFPSPSLLLSKITVVTILNVKTVLGPTRLELVTPALSEQCSNRLSYEPQNIYKKKRDACCGCQRHRRWSLKHTHCEVSVVGPAW